MAIKVFSENVMKLFADCNTDSESMLNLMSDLACGRELFDAESGKVISKSEANAKILEFSRHVFGITDVKNKKEVRRAVRDNGRVWYDIIEDTIDERIDTRFEENGWFSDLVDRHNIADGDRQDFVIEKDTILSVAKGGVSHHDHILQQLGEGEVIPVPTMLYVVKVGADINRYLQGDIDWEKYITAVADAFIRQAQADVMNAINTLPNKVAPAAQFTGTGKLDTTTKDAFDEIVANVSDANGGADVMIMGVHTGLSKINALQEGAFAAPAQKESVMNTGNVGTYEGSDLVMIPNRFKDVTFTQKVLNPKLLLILPVVGDEGKFIKMVDEGDTVIVEKTERGDYVSDLMTHEAQRKMGMAVEIGRKIGIWTLP